MEPIPSHRNPPQQNSVNPNPFQMNHQNNHSLCNVQEHNSVPSGLSIPPNPLLGASGSLPASLPHQLSQLCNSQQYPLLALQHNFSHLLPGYLETQQQFSNNQAHDNYHRSQRVPANHLHGYHHHYHHHHHMHHNHDKYNNNPNQKGHHNWRKSRKASHHKQTPIYSTGSMSLLDLSAKVVAQHIPFEAIEQRYDHIPEPVQRRVIFWSFPRHEDDIRLYSSLSSDAASPTGPSNPAPKTSNNQAQPPSNPAFAWDVTQAGTSTAGYSASIGKSQKQITFHKGLRLYEDGCVQNVLQVGFNLSGQVNVRVSQTLPPPNNLRVRHNPNIGTNQASNQNHDMAAIQLQLPGQASSDSVTTTNEIVSTKNYKVSVTFDRCKITSVSCSCNFQDIFWCEHVVALILLRLRNPETVDLRVPISETLLSLDRQQLQKLVQYIIAEHHTEVLPTAQRLLDQMSQSFSDINQTHGAPDPTAGACADDEHIWHLDEHQVNEKVQNYLNLVSINNTASKEAHRQIYALFEKIREMFRAKDSNGTRLLRLITEQFLHHATRNEKSRSLWDQLVFLWVVVMLNPDLTESCRRTFTQVIDGWSKVGKCPREDIERRFNPKRKATHILDDDDEEDGTCEVFCSGYPVNLGRASNNYPAHMATHRRNYPSSSGFSPLRPYNQPSLSSASTCPCQNTNPSKKMKTSGNNDQSSSSSRSRQSTSAGNHSTNRNNHQPSNENRPVASQEPRSIFSIVLDFQDASWDDPHLQLILNKDGPVNFDPSKGNLLDFAGNPLWAEPISQSAARIETLRSFGYKEQALRLTVATVRRLKLHQDKWRLAASHDADMSNHLTSLDIYQEGWIGHPFDPINVMVDMLLNASVNEPSGGSMSNTTNCTSFCGFNSTKCSCAYNQALMDFTHRLLPDLASLSYQQRVDAFPMLPLVNMPPRRASNSTSQATTDKTPYFHVPVPGCCQKDSYLTLAVELALIALGQQRSISTIASAYDRAIRQESDLIAKLESIDTSDPLLIDILKNQTTLLLDGGPYQNSCCGFSSDSAPLHTFARYLFDSLVPHFSQLAYKIGVYALKMPLSVDDGNENYATARAPPQNHLRAEQLALAQSMFTRAKEEKQHESFLRKVYRASVKNIRNPNNLLKLSKHVLKEGNSNVSSVQPSIQRALLQTAFDLGLQVLKLTLAPHSSNSKARREAIQFIVDCATDMGLDAVLQVMKDAREHFSATEALNLVVNREDCVNLRCSAITKLKLKENSEEEMKLTRRSKELALDCAIRDSPGCSLEAIKFCEADEDYLKRGLKIVIEAGANGSINSGHLIEVADYVYNLGLADKAFEIALVAVDIVSIPVNSDNTTSRKSITSACEYASKVNGFSILIPKLIRNINCATLLSDIYHKFSPNTNLLGPYRDFATGVLTYRNSLNYGNEYGDVMNNIGPDLYKQMSEESRWWAALLKHTMKTFVDITRSRLQNISPRHYGEFIDFLVKAQATFDKAPDGPEQFKNLVAEIIKAYRTKKKLMERLKERFDISYITGKV